MFIKFPTGLYSAVLPQQPSDGGNVTFLISTTAPPRSNLLFSKLPPGVEHRPRPLRLLQDETRRRVLDTLVYTVNRTSRVLAGSAMKEREIGELLDFPAPPEQLQDQFGPGTTTEIRHDTGLLDYDRLGITAEDQEAVELTGEAVFKQLQDQLSAQRLEYNSLQVELSENQKLTTETDKALAALTAMETTDAQILATIVHLGQLRAQLLGSKGTMVNRAAGLSRSIEVLLSRSLAVAQVVR